MDADSLFIMASHRFEGEGLATAESETIEGGSCEDIEELQLGQKRKIGVSIFRLLHLRLSKSIEY